MKNQKRMFYAKGVHKTFRKFIVKHLCQNLYFNKVAGLSSLCILLKTGLYIFDGVISDIRSIDSARA